MCQWWKQTAPSSGGALICRVQCSETPNKMCVVDAKNLDRPIFFQTENPQESTIDKESDR